ASVDVSGNPLRHHRRSIDRVWPPALEVKLARLSIDDNASASSPHMIIPVPPPVGYEVSEGMTEFSDKDMDETLRKSSQNAMASPTVLELDAQHQQHYRQLGEHSRLKVHYSPNHLPHAFQHHHHQYQYPSQNELQQSHLLLDSQHPLETVNEAKTGTLDETDDPHSTAASHGHHMHHPHHLLAKQPFYMASPMMMDTNEFGQDLFHDKTAFSSHPRRSSERHAAVPRPERRPGVYTNEEHKTDGEDEEDEEDEEEVVVDIDIENEHVGNKDIFKHGSDAAAPAESSTMAHAHLPVSRKGGPPFGSSAATKDSRAHSPLRKISSRSHSTSRSRSRSRSRSQSRTPLQERSLNLPLQHSVPVRTDIDIGHMTHEHTTNKSQATMGIENSRPASPVPAMMDMLTLMDNDQDRWKSPTLSALASKSSSLASSPRVRSPLGKETAETLPSSEVDSLVSRLNRQRMRALQRERHLLHHSGDMRGSFFSGHVPSIDMDAEQMAIPLIESRDEISLQDIWRMEDDERKDRLQGEEEEDKPSGAHASSITAHGHGADHLRKGEQHAHEEARLIQEVIAGNSH
ncbi:hypothetical protein BGZ94_002770, partial [Podila epigama]